MDLTDDLEQSDSGMESLTTSKDDTPERKPEESLIVARVSEPNTGNTSLKEYDDEPDETLTERLWGLAEMFPDCVRSATHSCSTKALTGIKTFYGVSRTVMWIVASSSVILFAPVIFEVERAQVDDMQKCQQKQVLLGTNAALSGPLPNLPMPR